jgi:hypothetical protein
MSNESVTGTGKYRQQSMLTCCEQREVSRE